MTDGFCGSSPSRRNGVHSGGKYATSTQHLSGIVAALHWARATAGVPHAVVLRTTPGKGLPSLERREKAHFVRIEPDDWDKFEKEFAALSDASLIHGKRRKVSCE